MKYLRSKLLTTVILVSTNLGYSIPSIAANECKIEYGFNLGSGAGKKNYVEYAFINSSETKTIMKSRLNYVKNLKAPKVKFHLNGGAKDITLNQGQVNPPAYTGGIYLKPVTLEKATCLSAGITNNQPQTPSSLAQTLKASGASIQLIATALKNAFNNSPAKLGEGLKAAGFSIDPITSVLKNNFNNSAISVSEGLKGAGYTLEQIAKILKNVLNLTRDQTEAALQTANFSIAQIKQTLDLVYKNTIRGLQISEKTSREALKKATGASAVSNMTLEWVFIGNYNYIGTPNPSAIPYSGKLSDCTAPNAGNTFYAINRISGPPLPLRADNRQITVSLVGRNLFTVDEVSGFPRGTNVRISARGDCGIQLRISVPRGREGFTGTAVLMSHGQRGLLSFEWTVLRRDNR